MRSLHDFYQTAKNAPSIVETAHFSLTIDTDSAELWVHWLETKVDGGADHHTELIMQALLEAADTRDGRHAQNAPQDP
jgi:hypothetical protein